MAITIVNNESELLSWISARNSQSTYTEDEIAQIASGVVITLTSGQQHSLNPVNAGSFSAIIESAPGGDPFSGRFWYVPSVGRSELRIGAYTGLDLMGKAKIRNLQIGRPTDGGAFRLGQGGQVERCILSTGNSVGVLFTDVTNSGKVINCLLIRTAVGGQIANISDLTQFIGCTVVNDGSTGNPFRSDFGGLRLIDTIVYGFDDLVTGTLAPGNTHNATSSATAFGSNCQTGLTSADFVSVTSGAEDYRRADNSVKLRNTGTANSDLVVDFYGTSRPQGGAYDIGAHEVVEAGDTTPPTLTGSVTATSVTATTASINWPTATDNFAVTEYEYNLNGGAFISSGAITSANLTGLTPSTLYNVSVRAKDAAGNVSTPAITGSFTTSAAADTTPPTMSGVVTMSSVTSASATASWSAGSDNVGVTGYEYRLNGGSYTSVGNVTSTSITGLTPSTAYTIDVRAFDAAGNRSATVSGSFNTSAATDTTPPTLTGSITVGTVTSTSVQLTWSAGSDNVAVTNYEVSSNNGSSYTQIGNVLTYTFTGLTPSTSYTFRVRAKDAAGNVSTPALSVTQSTSAAPVVTKRILLTLTTDGTSAAANYSGLKWAFFDQVTPDLFLAPSAKGAIESTDASGVLEIDVTASSLSIGQFGWLTITNSDGTITQNPPARAFSAPVQIVA